MQIRQVDCAAPDAPATFADSLRTTGFAVLRNHPLDAHTLRSVVDEWRAFFDGDTKHAHTFVPPDQSGYFPFRTENAKDSPVKDLKEFFHVYPRTQHPAGLSDATWRLYRTLVGFAGNILGWLDTATPAHVRAKWSQPLSTMTEASEDTLLRILHYPPLNGGEETDAIRAAAHEDINLITLLPAASEPGLQVKDSVGNWHEVSCDPGDLVVNAGDMLQMASEGFYRSTTHRVVNPDASGRGRSRYSLPLFVHPRPDVRLSSAYTARSYLDERLREIGLKG